MHIYVAAKITTLKELRVCYWTHTFPCFIGTFYRLDFYTELYFLSPLLQHLSLHKVKMYWYYYPWGDIW